MGKLAKENQRRREALELAVKAKAEDERCLTHLHRLMLLFIVPFNKKLDDDYELDRMMLSSVNAVLDWQLPNQLKEMKEMNEALDRAPTGRFSMGTRHKTISRY